MRIATFLAPSVLIFAITSANAQSAVAVVERGLNAYVKGDAVAAMKGWLEGSAMEGNTQATSQANTLRQIEDFYGKPDSYQILGEHSISDRSRMVYFVVNFAKGPAYGRMQAYRATSGNWIATEYRFHTDAPQVLPPHLSLGIK